MKKLKIILQSNIFYYCLFIFCLCYILIFTYLFKEESKITNLDVFTSRVYQINKKDDYVTLYVKASEKIKVNFYGNLDIKIGDEITISGNEVEIENNTIFNTFNYKKYLNNHHIYHVIETSDIKIISQSKNIFTKIKNFLYQKSSENSYLLLFIMGDKSFLDNDLKSAYQNLGVAHLLAISGMHVSVFIKILSFILKYLKKYVKEFIICIFLIFYAYLVSFTPSFLRVIVYYFLSRIFDSLNIQVDNIKKLILTFSILILFDAYYIYDIGFIYSFLASFSITLTKKYLTKNIILNIIINSFYITLFTIPVTLNLNYEINLLLFVTNVLLIPYVTYLLYPLSLVYFVLPFLGNIFNFFTKIMEMLVVLLNKVNLLSIIIPKLNIFVIIIYYILLLIMVYFNKRYLLLFLLLLLGIYKLLFSFNPNLRVVYLDVKQGDCLLILSPYNKKVIMIDTSGSIYIKNSYLVSNIILYLKSINISKIDYLILTHGDYDHIGNAFDLINNFKITNVLFNCGDYNNLEKSLVEVLAEKKIQYFSCVKNLNIDGYDLKFLNSQLFVNENDNSSVIYLKYNNYKFLFMGDASIETEKQILKKYNLSNIDFFKVGHHGSNTSSGKEFITEIKPKYSIISVGKNNRYGHPNRSVLDILEQNNSQIYRTDIDGSIEIKIKSDGYTIETCEP